MSWLRTISEAHTAATLLERVNAYARNVPEFVWGMIPAHARPPYLLELSQVIAWHVKVAAAMHATPNPGGPFEELFVVSLRAAARALQLQELSAGGANDSGAREAPKDGSAA